MPLRCAILDDYQNVALSMADWSKVAGDLEIKVFNEHLGSPDKRGESPTAFVRRMRGRDEPDLFEPPLLPALLGQNQVSEMDRIERAAKNADAHVPVLPVIAWSASESAYRPISSNVNPARDTPPYASDRRLARLMTEAA